MFQPNDFQIRSSVRYAPRPRTRLRWLDRLVIGAVILAGIILVGAAGVLFVVWGLI